MYFKKLEIIGFKSFYNKTTLHFEPGVTAVVGPNGCGKSNIFDSIRWVLGEQSVKSLRGSAMEDVIFSGTETKEALSMAEVNLTFDNSNKFFPVDHNEVVITRRIFRSGESEYLLNKTQVRLKDILDLLMDTGIGAESYSLIPQGRIDMILSSRPEDRRLVFDEASGITKYKTQKREALRKLEDTDQNLLRVNDIVTEVKRQIGSLERQANKARRYKEVFDELKAKELIQASAQKADFEKTRNEFIARLAILESQESVVANLIKEEEAAISGSQAEVSTLQEAVLSLKNEIMNLENLVSRNRERINLNKERITELKTGRVQLTTQLEQAKARLATDEEKLNTLKKEHAALNNNIEEKSALLKEKETRLNNISSAIKLSLENIQDAKKRILELVTRIAAAKNELADLTSRQQILSARKKRLELEKLKTGEEKAVIEAGLTGIKQELDSIQKGFDALNNQISEAKAGREAENEGLENINAQIDALEKQKLSLESQKQFLEELRTKYDDISESLNAVIYLDKIPAEKISGLVVKVTNTVQEGPGKLKVSGEAKPFDLDTHSIEEKINEIEGKTETLKKAKADKEACIQEFSTTIDQLQETLRQQEISLINKKAAYESASGQFNKIKEEEELIVIELGDVKNDLEATGTKINVSRAGVMGLEEEQRSCDTLITSEQNNITLNNNSKEEVLVSSAQIKTELDALVQRISSDSNNLKMLEGRYLQDEENTMNIEKQINDSDNKCRLLESEINELENKLQESSKDIADKGHSLQETSKRCEVVADSLSGAIKKIEEDKIELDTIKNKLYELQIQNKDIEFKYQSIKDRLLQAYKIDLEQTGMAVQDNLQAVDSNILPEEIQKLKDKLDSYGSVNLVAIEEYDELKKRYDFLTQQQTDLVTAKETLHEAILKINRTTKKMFLETFEKIQIEFRNYFKLLFNGGDAQVYLLDEQDPLESGIEIICRPPGKKLQNVLLLSGGEKSMSAIALIFAIFKIKPAPFCVLDEIDAALDEANVDRFGRTLQDFTKMSQFIVITHNKKTIANADVMYGITMQESGISKIVSVKFAQSKDSSAGKTAHSQLKEDANPDTQAVAESV